jgi:RNA polymerase sigma factor (sigma-70 family)
LYSEFNDEILTTVKTPKTMKTNFEKFYEANFTYYVMALKRNNPTMYIAHFQDIVQDALIKLWQNYEVDNLALNELKTLAWTSINNKLIDFVRMQKNQVREFEVGYENKTSQTPLASLMDKELSNGLNLALNGLTGINKSIADLLYNEEKSYREIAEILQIPLGSVCATISRLRGKLKNSFVKNYDMNF